MIWTAAAAPVAWARSTSAIDRRAVSARTVLAAQSAMASCASTSSARGTRIVESARHEGARLQCRLNVKERAAT